MALPKPDFCFPLSSLAPLLLALVFAATARADIYRVIGKGNTIAPLRSSEVAMDAETVEVFPESDFGGFCVRATFTMRNTSDERVTCQVAFPFDTRGAASVARDSFKVRIGDERVEKIELKVRDAAIAAPSAHDFPAALVWAVQWEPRATLLIHVDYAMGEPEQYYGFVDGWRLRYIVRTGALWKGPIGRAEITFRLTGQPMLADHFAQAGEKSSHLQPPYSYPAAAVRTSPTEVTWRFERWTPQEDIWLGVIQWAGFGPNTQPRIFIRTPHPYGGATSAYADALLESLVERELEPWRGSFPKEAERDRPVLKAVIAEWLYRELFARHGDPFYLGKYVAGERPPIGSQGRNQDDNYLSVWSTRFPLAARGRGGWYEPRTGPGPNGSVRLSDLTPQERRNAEFLSAYFKP